MVKLWDRTSDEDVVGENDDMRINKTRRERNEGNEGPDDPYCFIPLINYDSLRCAAAEATGGL